MSAGIIARLKPAQVLLAACLLVLAGAASAIAAVQVVGIAAAVVKDVRIKQTGAAQAAPARLRQRIAMGDQVILQ